MYNGFNLNLDLCTFTAAVLLRSDRSFLVVVFIRRVVRVVGGGNLDRRLLHAAQTLHLLLVKVPQLSSRGAPRHQKSVANLANLYSDFRQ